MIIETAQCLPNVFALLKVGDITIKNAKNIFRESVEEEAEEGKEYS